MSQQPEEPFRDSDLQSAEYRQRLMRKLNCLIAVLEVASAKVRRGLAGPAPDVERLTRIQSNLSNTLEVCRRARRALERHQELPANLPVDLSAAVREVAAADAPRALPRGAEVEMISGQEARRFERMGPISTEEVRACDLDSLAERLTRH